jgi:hypothetical protein
VSCGDGCRWTCCHLFASRGPGVRVPLAPLGQRHNSKSWAPGLEAGTAAKYSYGDRIRCRTRVRTGLLLRRQRPRIPGRERNSGAAEQEECSSLQSFPTCPAASVRGAGSAVPRLTLAAEAGGQSELVLSAVAGIAPVLVDQMGAGARSRPARRRPELTAHAAAPVRVAASSSWRQGPFCAVAHVGTARAQRQARRSARGRRADPVRPGALDDGRQAADSTAGSGRHRPTGTGPGCGRLARGRPYALPGRTYRTHNLADYLK